ncbi:hypothetical protein [Paenibacillus solani]|uniref:hypothetical protein n=1 Tax=Paenibacillus solani TaxID=1705565 RepID=UPI003D2DB8EA
MSKKWYYIIAILFVTCSWIGNVWYYEANQLSRTAFLEHHVETREGDGQLFDLYYVEDKRADVTLRSIGIEGYPDLIVTSQPHYAEYQRQYLGKMMVNLNKPSIQKEPAEELSAEPVLVQEITANYTDGTSEQVDIGEIYIWPAVYQQGAQDPISWTSSGSSSDNTGYTSGVVARPVELTAFASKLMDIVEAGDLQINADISGQVPGRSHQTPPSEAQIELSGDPIKKIALPLKINQGSSIRISHKFNMHGSLKSMKVYQFMLRTTFVEDGRRWYEDTIIPYQVWPMDKEMTEFVRKGRKGS